MIHSRSLVWLLIALCILCSVCAETVKITGYINDYAGIISPEYSAKLNPILKDLQDKQLAEFAIVTIKSLEGRDIEGYALELAQGVLGSKDKNNGLLLLVALDERQYRFEVGRGLEPYLPDSKVGTIGRTYLIPNFKTQEYGKGIYESVLAIQSVLMNDIESQYYVKEGLDIEAIYTIILFFIWLFLVLFVIFGRIFRERIEKHTKDKSDKYFNAAFMAIWMLDHSGHGGHGGSGGSGGFGGFGGGGFGGGGSSGGW